MTVSSTQNSVTYAGNGSSVNFAVPFYFLADAHLRVVRRAADGAETLQVITTNYTVTGAGNPSGGQVAMLVAPPTGTTLTIRRVVPATQEVDYVTNDAFPAETHERALDKLTMLAGGLAESMSRALVLRETDVDGAGAFDGRSNRITNLEDGTSASDAVTLSQMQAFVTDIAQFGASGVPRFFTFVAASSQQLFSCPGIDVADPSAYIVTDNGLVLEPYEDYTVDTTNERIVTAVAVTNGHEVTVRVLGFERSITTSLPGTAASFYRGDGVISQELVTTAGAGISAPSGGVHMLTLRDTTAPVLRFVSSNGGAGGTAYSVAGSGRTYDMALLYNAATEALTIQSDSGLGVLQIRHQFNRDGSASFGAGNLVVTPSTVTVTGTFAANIDGASITSGFVSPARLGSGTPDSSTVLFGDGVWRTGGGGGGGWSDEQSQDAIGNFMAPTATITPTYADGTPQFSWDINALSITSGLIAAGAVVAGKIGANAVTATEIAAGAVTSAKLDTNIAITGNLTVDTTTLVADATANKVGVLRAPVSLATFQPALQVGFSSGVGGAYISLHGDALASGGLLIYDGTTLEASWRYTGGGWAAAILGVNYLRVGAGLVAFENIGASGTVEFWTGTVAGGGSTRLAQFSAGGGIGRISSDIVAASATGWFELAPRAADPGSPSDGQFWYNSTTGQFKLRQGGSTITLTGGAYSAEQAQDDVYGIFISSATIAPSYVDGSNQFSASVIAGSIGSTQLANLGVTSGKIAAGAVGTTQIAAQGVATGNVADGAITSAKLATAAVTAQKINASGAAALRMLRITADASGMEWTNAAGGGSGMPGVYNVKDYGATGDGFNDDTSAIATAISTCNGAGGGVVYFPPGTYSINSAINLTTSNVSLIGAGARVSIIQWSTTGGNMVNITGFAARHIAIHRLTFRGTASSRPDRVFNLGAIQHCSFRDLELTQFTAYGIYALPDVAAVDMAFNDFHSIAIDARNSGATTSACGIYMDGGNGSPTIRNCCHNTFEQIAIQHAGGYAIDMRDTDNNRFGMVFTFKVGTFYDIHFGARARANYFFHVQGEVESDGSPDCWNHIVYYDRENGQRRPLISNGSSLDWNEFGGNAIVDGTCGFQLTLGAIGAYAIRFRSDTGDIHFTSPIAGTRRVNNIAP